MLSGSRAPRCSTALCRAQRGRGGYSYVEMLLVITIIGVLVSLLLPAVQAAREAARRINCAQNLVQLIAAVQIYELHHGCYPPGTIDRQGPILSQPAGYHHNWISHILPYLDHKTTYRHVDYRVGVYDTANRPVRKLDLPILQCPSLQRQKFGYSDYAGVHHDSEAPIDVTNNGVFFLNSHIRYEDLWDGSSQTLFIGEKWTILGDLGWMSGTRATLRNAGAPINWIAAGLPDGPPPDLRAAGTDAPEETRSDPSSASEKKLITLLLPEHPMYSRGGEISRGLGRSRDAAKLRERVPAKRPHDVRLIVGGFAGVHPGGAQFAMGDGSVRFLAQTTDYELFGHLANRSDGELSVSGDYW